MWLVPIFGPPAAIHEIARVVRSFDYSDRRLRSWLYSLAALSLLKPTLALYLRRSFREVRTDAQALRALEIEVLLEAAAVGLLAIAAVLATRAVLHADRAISAQATERLTAHGERPAPVVTGALRTVRRMDQHKLEVGLEARRRVLGDEYVEPRVRHRRLVQLPVPTDRQRGLLG